MRLCHVSENGGRRTVVRVPERTAAERAAYLARLDAAIRKACPGWRLAKSKAASVADDGRRVGEYGESETG